MNNLLPLAVINTGAGNLFSLCACLNRLGYETELIASPAQLTNKSYQSLVIPGQGRFGAVMNRLISSGLSKVIKDWYLSDKSIIAICVGMQILFESSEEDDWSQGLSLFNGQVTKLKSPKQPMVGWCSLQSDKEYLNQKDLYFVNSFAVKESELATSYANYGEQFVSSIASRGLKAFQFHPEKSGSEGEEILKQCLNQV